MDCWPGPGMARIIITGQSEEKKDRLELLMFAFTLKCKEAEFSVGLELRD